MYSERLLYGGAITCDIPSTWRDVSDVRQVPDHQECWQEIGDDGALLVVEILNRQPISDEEAANFFFHDLAEANGIDVPESSGTKATVATIPTSSCHFQVQALVDKGNMAVAPGVSVATPCSGIGIQRIAIGKDTDIAGNPRKQEIKLTRVELCALRLSEVRTDILVTVSKPIDKSNSNEPIEAINVKSFSDAFCRCIASITIKDWSLFGG